MIELILLISFILIIYTFFRKDYILTFFLSIVSLYQYSYTICYHFFPEYFNDRGFGFLVQSYNDDNINKYLVLSLIFIFLILLGYYNSNNIVNYKPLNISTDKNRPLVRTLSYIILIIGIIATIKGAGDAAISTYDEYNTADLSISDKFRVLAYGSLLLPIAFYYFLVNIIDKRAKVSYNILLSSSFVLFQLFLSGRRQFLSPLISIGFIYLLNKKILTKRNILIYAPVVMIISGLLFAMQFALRSAATGYDLDQSLIYDDFLGGIFLPQFDEFIGSGATSLASYILFIDLYKFEPFGVHDFISTLVSNLPGIRLFSIINTYRDPNFDLKLIAPYGALTVFAEAIMFFGYFGILIFGLALGLVLNIFDKIFNAVSLHNFSNSYKNSIIFCLSCILLFKYRSGIIDPISTSIFFLFASYLLKFISDSLKP